MINSSTGDNNTASGAQATHISNGPSGLRSSQNSPSAQKNNDKQRDHLLIVKQIALGAKDDEQPPVVHQNVE